MRLWSIHPKYMDAKGLTALWREALLAKKVLQGKTKGYKSHPQLIRFRNSKNPLGMINSFLFSVYQESCKRGYCFDKSKIGKKSRGQIKATKGQIEYEFNHLKKKLKARDPAKHKEILKAKKIQCNPVFSVVKGNVEKWEKT